MMMGHASVWFLDLRGNDIGFSMVAWGGVHISLSCPPCSACHSCPCSLCNHGWRKVLFCLALGSLFFYSSGVPRLSSSSPLCCHWPLLVPALSLSLSISSRSNTLLAKASPLAPSWRILGSRLGREPLEQTCNNACFCCLPLLSVRPCFHPVTASSHKDHSPGGLIFFFFDNPRCLWLRGETEGRIGGREGVGRAEV